MPSQSVRDEAWHDALIQQHTGRITTMLARRLSDPEAVRDLAQDTWATAWRKRDSVPDEPLPWLYVVAQNHLRNHWRTAKKHAYVPLDQDTLGHIGAEPAADAFVDEPAIELAGRLDRLSIEDQKILELRYQENLDCNEIAKILSIQPAAARKRLERARKNVGQLLQGDEVSKGGGNDQP